jgi:hypothetical protein
MSVSHGDLFGEIGKLVLAAQAGEQIDLDAKSEELALRYRNLGVSEEVIAKAITRSIGAISFSMARVSLGEDPAGESGAPASNGHDALGHDTSRVGSESSELPALPKSIFPSGVRLAVLS